MDEPTLTAYLTEALAQSESFAAPGKSQRVLQAMYLSIEMRWYWASKAIEALGYGALRRLEVVKPSGERTTPQRLPECVVQFIAVDRRMDAIAHLLDRELCEALDAKSSERSQAYDTAYANRFPNTPAPAAQNPSPARQGAVYATHSPDLGKPPARPAAPPQETPGQPPLDDEDVDLEAGVEVDDANPLPATPPDESESDDEDAVVIAL